ncbi:hypothetical protein BOTBODRAFT_233872 [Botryobasidium botryosum FD-172 SS1]|uniref:Uncharacterized protein n=1 Tax=Botryobasidium botryosum (strain FD-172 SS1) TaxID=930990 RepID=A0A067LUB1_BOTB1|nr:hypothetical protein BOTBODRAFT_233872 [Botryobasidium botryosum FD-172 SS1]
MLEVYQPNNTLFLLRLIWKGCGCGRIGGKGSARRWGSRGVSRARRRRKRRRMGDPLAAAGARKKDAAKNAAPIWEIASERSISARAVQSAERGILEAPPVVNLLRLHLHSCGQLELSSTLAGQGHAAHTKSDRRDRLERATNTVVVYITGLLCKVKDA